MVARKNGHAQDAYLRRRRLFTKGEAKAWRERNPESINPATVLRIDERKASELPPAPG